VCLFATVVLTTIKIIFDIKTVVMETSHLQLMRKVLDYIMTLFTTKCPLQGDRDDHLYWELDYGSRVTTSSQVFILIDFLN